VDLPPDDEEEDEEAEENRDMQEDRKVRIEEGGEEAILEQGNKSLVRSSSRKATGFVKLVDLPPDDEEEEDEEEDENRGMQRQLEQEQEDKKVRIEEGSEEATHECQSTRKGTGFVKLGDLPPDEDEGEDTENVKHVNDEVQDDDDWGAEDEERAASHTEESAAPKELPEEPTELELSTEERRASFEDRIRPGRRSSKRAAPREADQFLNLLRDKGNGSITVAWRRFFDSDGDGQLSFSEFCSAVVTFDHKGDVLKLWKDLAGSTASTLTLEVVDPEGFGMLQFFESWCTRSYGGPAEAFQKIDDDGSDSLTSQEFADGLEHLGFFTEPVQHPKLCSKGMILGNLWPMLDQNGRGCVTADQLLFLESDLKKREKIRRELIRIRTYGVASAPEPLRRDAPKILSKLVMQTTAMGNKHWSQVREGHVAVGVPAWASQSQTSLGSHAGKKPRAIKRVASDPGASLGMKAFLDELRGDGDGGCTPGASPSAEAALPRLQPAPGASTFRPHVPHREPPVPKWTASLKKPITPRGKRDDRRKAYCGSLVPPLPYLKTIQQRLDATAARAPDAQGDHPQVAPSGQSPYSTGSSLPKRKEKARTSKGLGFNPGRTQDFLSTQKRDQLWQHYLSDQQSEEAGPGS